MGIDKIHIGEMDRRIEINIRVKTKTDIGSEAFVPDTIATVWAKRQSISSSEEVGDNIADNKIVAVDIYQYTIRHHPDIVGQTIQNLYIIDEGQEFDIYGGEPVGRQGFLKLKAIRRE